MMNQEGKFRLIIFSSLLMLINVTPATASSIRKVQDYSSQIPSVSQLSDVSPDDWAYEALRSLVERYGCISGFPDGSYRGNQTLTRNEFAVALNNCLQNIESLDTQIERDTLATIQRLQSEFSPQLTRLGNKIEQLETRVTTLENQQFSPNLELEGEVIFAPLVAIGGNKADGSGESVEENVALGNRVRLTLESSFTGKDELKVRLQSRQVAELEEVTGTQMSNLGFDGDDGEQFEIDELGYQFLLGQQTSITLSTGGEGLGDYVPTVSRWFSGSSDGSISTFGRENPIRRQGEGAGLGISHDFSDAINFSTAYVAIDSEDPEAGLFYGPFAAIAQVTFTPLDSLAFSLTYTNSYNSFNTGTGSRLTGNPFNDSSDAIKANAYGAEAAIAITPTFNIGGRIGYLEANAKDLSENPEADILTWTAFLALEDVGTEGSVAGLIFGQPPKVIDNSFGEDFEDPDTSLHIEAFYQLPLNDNIAITPGMFVITNPEHNSNNDTIYIGTIRTTFSF
ncbi:iron uptake porin [Stanieria cyanosphaera]|nr:iron uptake porin [Stanieria cyanosphaera]